MEQRIIRLPLPVELIRRMDSVIIQGIGGFGTRAEFIIDAIQERILELTIGEEIDAGAPQSTVLDLQVEERSLSPETKFGFEATAIAVIRPGFSISDSGPALPVEGKALFGLHNRDYPSLWALRKLAELTADGPINAESFYKHVLSDAEQFARILMAIEKTTGLKCTALFPTNPEKPRSAEGAFRMFAVGDYRKEKSGALTSFGPLFEWSVASFVQNDGEVFIGVTTSGWKLLDSCSGLSVEEPHPQKAAISFFRHLAKYAGPDWLGFVEVLKSIGPAGAARQGVLDHFRARWLEWTVNEVATNAAGYIARAREWGLVEQKQVRGQYHLTKFGSEQFSHLEEGDIQ